MEGGENDLLNRLRNDPAFNKVNIDAELEPSAFIGRSPEQVDEFINEYIEPTRQRYEDILININTNTVIDTEVRV
jgi:adenylosuccinate lyase